MAGVSSAVRKAATCSGASGLAEPRPAALSRRVALAEDPALTALVPAERWARMKIVLGDGAGFEASVCGSAGDYDRPYDEAWLRAKFGQLVPDAAPDAYDRLLAIESWDDLRPLPDLLGPRKPA